MFSDFKEYLSNSSALEICKEGEPSTKDLQLAVAAVLLQIVKVDGQYADNELEALFGSLCVQFDIAASAASELVDISKFLLKEDASRIDNFAELIRTRFSVDQRMRVLGLAWKIAVADQHLDSREVALLTELRKRLDLSPEQAMSAQQKASMGGYDTDKAIS